MRCAGADGCGARLNPAPKFCPEKWLTGELQLAYAVPFIGADGKIVPVRPNLSRTVSMGVVNPVGPKPMNPDPDPVWLMLGREGDPFNLGKLKAV